MVEKIKVEMIILSDIGYNIQEGLFCVSLLDLNNISVILAKARIPFTYFRKLQEK